jgi:hypothetical protein
MPTGTKKGFSAARNVGSGPDNKGLTPYAIASGYATALGMGDPVKLAADGTLQRATNDTANSIGVFQSVRYTDSQGNIVFSKMWPASTVATDIEALVIDNPFATFNIPADATIASVAVGEIYAVNIANADAATGRSTIDVDVAATTTAALGMVKVVGITDLENNVLEVVLVDHSLRDDG